MEAVPPDTISLQLGPNVQFIIFSHQHKKDCNFEPEKIQLELKVQEILINGETKIACIILNEKTLDPNRNEISMWNYFLNNYMSHCNKTIFSKKYSTRSTLSIREEKINTHQYQNLRKLLIF